MQHALGSLSYVGPPVSDPDVLSRVPVALQELLLQTNGFIAFGGGLHIRGASLQPAWHSLREAWLSEGAFHWHYPAVHSSDVPFAQDCVGDQFLLRDGQVHRLASETGEVEELGAGLLEWLAQVQADPQATLGLEPLLQFQADGEELQPGELLNVYPPFCTKEAANGVSLQAVPVGERLALLVELSKVIAGLPEGGTLGISTSS